MGALCTLAGYMSLPQSLERIVWGSECLEVLNEPHLHPVATRLVPRAPRSLPKTNASRNLANNGLRLTSTGSATWPMHVLVAVDGKTSHMEETRQRRGSVWWA